MFTLQVLSLQIQIFSHIWHRSDVLSRIFRDLLLIRKCICNNNGSLNYVLIYSSQLYIYSINPPIHSLASQFQWTSSYGVYSSKCFMTIAVQWGVEFWASKMCTTKVFCILHGKIALQYAFIKLFLEVEWCCHSQLLWCSVIVHLKNYLLLLFLCTCVSFQYHC